VADRLAILEPVDEYAPVAPIGAMLPGQMALFSEDTDFLAFRNSSRSTRTPSTHQIVCASTSTADRCHHHYETQTHTVVDEEGVNP